jgi:hypothetical protein
MIRFLVAVLLLCSSPQAALQTAEINALIDLYSSTNGNLWDNNTNWLDGDPCENRWFGVSCNDTGSVVVTLALPRNNLAGYIPPSFANLTSMTTM